MIVQEQRGLKSDDMGMYLGIKASPGGPGPTTSLPFALKNAASFWGQNIVSCCVVVVVVVNR